MKSTRRIKVMIVDDSAVVRSILTRVLSEESDIKVVAGAKDPYEARQFIIECRPDVIILDIEMPRMDGLTFLKKLQAHYPVPVIMCSGVAPANSHAALTAISEGAIDVVAKPTTGGSAALAAIAEDLAEKVRAAAIAARPRPRIPVSATAKPRTFREAAVDPSRYLVAIGASTGGTEAINQLLTHVPPDFPPVAIVQHMPAGFTKSFAERLDQFSPMTVTEAVEGDVLEPGRVVVARGEVQMELRFLGGQWRVSYGDDRRVNRHCPSVDVMFDSIVRHGADRVVGVLLTGMGADGAKGLLRLRESGASTIAQDQESSIVYGMPKAAVDLGAVEQSAAPNEVPGKVMQILQRPSKRSSSAATKRRRRVDAIGKGASS